MIVIQATPEPARFPLSVSVSLGQQVVLMVAIVIVLPMAMALWLWFCGGGGGGVDGEVHDDVWMWKKGGDKDESVDDDGCGAEDKGGEKKSKSTKREEAEKIVKISANSDGYKDREHQAKKVKVIVDVM